MDGIMQACIFKDCRGPTHGKLVCGNSFFDIKACPDCSMERVYPPRTQEQLNALHADPAYFNHPYFTARRSLNDSSRRESYRKIVREMFPQQVPSGVRLLDVGCDTGAFLDVAKQDFKMSVAGVEISPVSAQIAKEKGFNVYVGSILDLEIEEKFDAIVLNDVIEHVAMPDILVEKLALLLKPGGRLFISTPNADALIYKIGQFIFKIFGRQKILDKLYLPYHEWYFSPENLGRLVKEKGLTVIRQKPVEFPLSEFGHGFLLKLSLSLIFILQKLTGRPSIQFLIAERKLVQ
jgi:2-polyprenyl-3-methyl-5-hydroxy-6-metoxy-1,4-benzoquinol methylase